MASLITIDPDNSSKKRALVTTPSARLKARRTNTNNPQHQDMSDVGIAYPKNIKQYNKTLRQNDPEIKLIAMTYNFGKGDVPKTISVKDNFKLGLKYVPNNNNTNKTINFLKRRLRRGSTEKDKLPIYWINAHSSIDMNIVLTPPSNMDDETAKEEREYDEKAQLMVGFAIDRASDNITKRDTTPPDFFETKEGVFVVLTAPIGYDAVCSDDNQTEFLQVASTDGFVQLRQSLLSEGIEPIFSRGDSNMNIFKTPPHNSAINRIYSFFDPPTISSNNSRDKFGIIRLDKKTQPEWLTHWQPGEKKTSSRVELLNPGMVPEIKSLIQARTFVGYDVSLKEITEALGPGIYLDAACSGINVNMWDVAKKEWLVFEPDQLEEYNKIQPIYDIIIEDLDDIRRMQKLGWNNIVANRNISVDQGEVKDDPFKNNLLEAAANFTATNTTANENNQINSTENERVNEAKRGGKPRISRRRKRGKSKTRKSKTRKSKTRKRRKRRKRKKTRNK